MSVSCIRARVLRVLLALLLLAQGLPWGATAQVEGETTVENVRFEVVGELVRIHYDLNAPLDKVHEVRLSLRREGDITYHYRPLNITGDVGTIVIPGQGRRIVWEYLREFPDGLPGDDYYFIVEAEYVAPPSNIPWLWIGSGAALVGGVVGLLLLGGGGDTPPPPVPNTFPVPPARP